MDRSRLNAILESYGADPARWPEAEREAALRSIEADPEMKRALGAARVLDAMLAKVPAGEVTHGLLTRIYETAPRPVGKPLSKARSGGLRFGDIGGLLRLPGFGAGAMARPLAMVMLAVVVGLGASTLVPTSSDVASNDTALLSVMWGSPPITQDGANW